MLENQKCKILFLITKSNWGGAQKYVFDLATNLNPDQFQIQVAVSGNGTLVKKLQATNTGIIQIKSLQRDVNLFKEIYVFLQLVKIIWQEKPDILHLNSAKVSGLGAVIGRILAIKKIIFTCHGWAFNEERSWLQKKIIFYLSLITVLLSHQTICVSIRVKQDLINQIHFNFLANFFKKFYLQKIEDRMQTISLATQESNPQINELLESKIDKNKINIVTIAELHPIKGHDIAIQSLQKLQKENNFQNFIYHIIGAGQEKNNLENLILQFQNTNLQNISPNTENIIQDQQSQSSNYVFHGNIFEASKYLPEFDLFLLTSQSESFGYVILEAALAGLPIITHNVGATEEILKNYSNKKIINIYENSENQKNNNQAPNLENNNNYKKNNLIHQKKINKEKQIQNLSLVLQEILEQEKSKSNIQFLQKANPEEIEILKNKFNLLKMILETEKVYLE